MMRKQYLTDADWQSIKEKHAAWTPEQHRAWLRKIMVVKYAG